MGYNVIPLFGPHQVNLSKAMFGNIIFENPCQEEKRPDSQERNSKGEEPGTPKRPFVTTKGTPKAKGKNQGQRTPKVNKREEHNKVMETANSV